MGVIVELIQGRTEIFAEWIQRQIGVFTEWMQGRYLYVLRYLVSIFSNLASILITMLGLSDYSNRHQATIAMTHNKNTNVKGL
jgi:hypothetical protein